MMRCDAPNFLLPVEGSSEEQLSTGTLPTGLPTWPLENAAGWDSLWGDFGCSPCDLPAAQVSYPFDGASCWMGASEFPGGVAASMMAKQWQWPTAGPELVTQTWMEPLTGLEPIDVLHQSRVGSTSGSPGLPTSSESQGDVRPQQTTPLKLSSLLNCCDKDVGRDDDKVRCASDSRAVKPAKKVLDDRGATASNGYWRDASKKVGAAASAKSNSMPSIGSSGHHSGRCSPCVLFQRGACQKGYNCHFCHHSKHLKCGEQSVRRHAQNDEKRELQSSRKSSKYTCPNGHNLEHFPWRSAYEGHMKYICDRCEQQVPEDASIYGCRKCNYGECEPCCDSNADTQVLHALQNLSEAEACEVLARAEEMRRRQPDSMRYGLSALLLAAVRHPQERASEVDDASKSSAGSASSGEVGEGRVSKTSKHERDCKSEELSYRSDMQGGKPTQVSLDEEGPWTTQRFDELAKHGRFELNSGEDGLELVISMRELDPQPTCEGVKAYCRWLQRKLRKFRTTHTDHASDPCFAQIDFSRNKLGDRSIGVLLRAFRHADLRVTSLRLSKNRIGADGVLHLCDFLRFCPTAVDTLDLAHNDIDEDSTLKLLRALAEHQAYPPQRSVGTDEHKLPRPVWLRLQNNKIRDPGQLVLVAEAQLDICVCLAQDRQKCGHSKCARRSDSRCPLVHLHEFMLQARSKRDGAARKERYKQNVLERVLENSEGEDSSSPEAFAEEANALGSHDGERLSRKQDCSTDESRDDAACNVDQRKAGRCTVSDTPREHQDESGERCEPQAEGNSPEQSQPVALEEANGREPTATQRAPADPTSKPPKILRRGEPMSAAPGACR